MHTYSPYRLALSEPGAHGLAIGEKDMKSRSTVGLPGAALRAIGVAVALVCSTGASVAGDATLSITSFTVTGADFSGTFAFALDPFQSYNLTALEAAGINTLNQNDRVTYDLENDKRGKQAAVNVKMAAE